MVVLAVWQVMGRLAQSRPVFHSEADFQHALAWQVHQMFPEAGVRLEYRPFPVERFYVDIWAIPPGSPPVALELKYRTRGLDVEQAGERFSLADQAAQNHARYDFVRDIVRLERIVADTDAIEGWAVLLTNDSAYWKPSVIDTPVDTAFRIEEGRALSGQLAWAERAVSGTTRGRQASHRLRGIYRAEWADYSQVEPSHPYGLLRYLAFCIQDEGQGAD